MDVSVPPESSSKAVLDGLDVDHGKRQHGKGAPGSRENPEVCENVPGHVIPILEDEFDDFTSAAGDFLAGEREELEFVPFRLKQGVYGQRQADVQMIRVKLPFGGVSPEQMEAFADAIERWVPMRKGHITTRQNIQLHHVPLADAAELIRELGKAGLSSREGCGNTVRNVTADPYAGIANDEVFDPTPYAGAYVRYFVRHPVTQAMPRKWKTAFSASPADRAIVPIHDIGFLPVIRDGVRGFEVWVGGGTAIMPRLAHKIYDFVGADDGAYLRVTEAIVRIFDRQDWLRKNRARARIKVLLDKIGPDAFRALVDEELRGGWTAEPDYAAELERLRFDDDEEAEAPARRRRLRLPERRPLAVRHLRRAQRHRAAPAGLLGGRRQGHARRPHPGAVPRPGDDHARVLRRLRPHHGRAEHDPALGPRRGALRRLEPAPRARPRAAPAPSKSTT